MPHVDGYQATQMIRKNETLLSRRVPIIALTAHAYSSERTKCLTSGMDDFIAKPYRLEELYETLKRNLEGGDNIVMNSESTVQKTNENPIIFDQSAVEQLRAIDPDNSNFIFELVKQYFSDAPNYLEEILSSSSNKKYEILQHFAHTLKSSSATLGGMKLANTCQLLERNAAESKVDEINELVNAISTDYSEFKSELERNLSITGANHG